MSRSYVFYEDKAAEVSNFGPHRLLCSCVASLLGKEGRGRALQKLIPMRACGGAPKQIAQIAADAAEMIARGTEIFALFDDDKIREQVQLRREADEDRLRQVLREKGIPVEVQIFFLSQNTETLEQHVRVCLLAGGHSVSSDLPSKSPLKRDQIFNRAADAAAAVHQGIVNKAPTFAALVTAIAGKVSGEVA